MNFQDYISKMGYSDNSPFREFRELYINTPDGTIDMTNTSIPIEANGRILPPNSGLHQFNENVVRERPVNPWATTTPGFKYGELPARNRMSERMRGNAYRDFHVNPFAQFQTVNTPDGPLDLSIGGVGASYDIPIGKNTYISPGVGLGFERGKMFGNKVFSSTKPSANLSFKIKQFQEGGEDALSNKISKLHKEGYTAKGQAYAIAKSMGYQEGGSVKDVHDAANLAGMEWDNNSEFMAFSKRITGKEHIDDMTPAERRMLINAIRTELPKAQIGKTITEGGKYLLEGAKTLKPYISELTTQALGYAKELFPQLLNPNLENLEDLYSAKDFASKYNYDFPENLAFLSETNLRTDKAIQDMMNVHNTFSRGVNTDWNYLEEQKPEVLELLKEAGIDYINEPEKAAEYMLTHIPGKTGYGRAGLNTSWNEAGLYTSNSEGTADPYTYGSGYRGKIRRLVDYTSSDRKDWITENDFNLASRDYTPLTKEEDIIWGEAYDKLDRWDDKTRTNPKFSAREKILKEKIIVGDLKEQDITYEQAFANIDKEINDKISEIQELPEYGGVRFDLDRKQGDPFSDAERKSLTTFRQYATYGTDPLYVELRDLEAKKWNLKVNLNSETNRWQGEEAVRSLKEDYPELYKKKAPSMLKIDQGVMKQDYSNADINNPYAHYVFMGYPGQKVAEPISLEKMTDAKLAESSRAHKGIYSEGYSKKYFGGELPYYQGGGGIKYLEYLKGPAKYINTNVLTPIGESIGEGVEALGSTKVGQWVGENIGDLFSSILSPVTLPPAEYLPATAEELKKTMSFTDYKKELPKYASTIKRDGINYKLKVSDKLDKISDPDFTVKGKPASVPIIKTSEWGRHRKNLNRIHGVPFEQLDDVKKYMDEEGITEINTKDLINRIDKELSFDIKFIPRQEYGSQEEAADFVSTFHDPLNPLAQGYKNYLTFSPSTSYAHDRGFIQIPMSKLENKGFRTSGSRGDVNMSRTRPNEFSIPWTAPGGSKREWMDYFWAPNPEHKLEGIFGQDKYEHLSARAKRMANEAEPVYYRQLTGTSNTEAVPISREEYVTAMNEYGRRLGESTTTEYKGTYSLPEYQDDKDWIYKEAEIVTPQIINNETAHFSSDARKSPQNTGAEQRVLGHVRYYENINPDAAQYGDLNIGEVQSDILQNRENWDKGNYMRYDIKVKESYLKDQKAREENVQANLRTDRLNVEQTNEKALDMGRAEMNLNAGRIGISPYIGNTHEYTNTDRYFTENTWNYSWHGQPMVEGKGKHTGNGVKWIEPTDLPYNSKFRIEVEEPEYWHEPNKKEATDVFKSRNEHPLARGNTYLYSEGSRHKTGDEISIFKEKNAIGITKYYVEYHYMPEGKTNEAAHGVDNQIINGDVVGITEGEFYKYLEQYTENQLEFVSQSKLHFIQRKIELEKRIPFRKEEVIKEEKQTKFITEQLDNHENQNNFYKYLAKNNNWMSVFQQSIIQSLGGKARRINWPHHLTAAKMQTHKPHHKKIDWQEKKIAELEKKRHDILVNQSGKGVIGSESYKKALDDTEYQIKNVKEGLKKLTEWKTNKKGEPTEYEGMHKKSPVEYIYYKTFPDKLETEFGPVFMPREDKYGYKWGTQEIGPKTLEKTETIKFREGGMVTPWNTLMILPPEAYIGTLPKFQKGGQRGGKALAEWAKEIYPSMRSGVDKVTKLGKEWWESMFDANTPLNHRLTQRVNRFEDKKINAGYEANVTLEAVNRLFKDSWKAARGVPTDLPTGYTYEPFTLEEEVLMKSARLLGNEMYKFRDIIGLSEQEMASRGISKEQAENTLSFLKTATEGHAQHLSDEQFKKLTGHEKSELGGWIEKFQNRLDHLSGLKTLKEPTKTAELKDKEGSPTIADEIPALGELRDQILASEGERLTQNAITELDDPEYGRAGFDTDTEISTQEGESYDLRNFFTQEEFSPAPWHELSGPVQTMIVSDMQRAFGNDIGDEPVDFQFVRGLWDDLNTEEKLPYIHRIMQDPLFTASQRTSFANQHLLPPHIISAYNQLAANSIEADAGRPLLENDLNYLRQIDERATWNIARVMEAVTGDVQMDADQAVGLLGEALNSMPQYNYDEFWSRYGDDIMRKWPVIDPYTIPGRVRSFSGSDVPLEMFFRLLNDPGFRDVHTNEFLERLSSVKQALLGHSPAAWNEFWSMAKPLFDVKTANNSDATINDEPATIEQLLSRYEDEHGVGRLLSGIGTGPEASYSLIETPRVNEDALGENPATADPDWDAISPTDAPLGSTIINEEMGQFIAGTPAPPAPSGESGVITATINGREVAMRRSEDPVPDQSLEIGSQEPPPMYDIRHVANTGARGIQEAFADIESQYSDVPGAFSQQFMEGIDQGILDSYESISTQGRLNFSDTRDYEDWLAEQDWENWYDEGLSFQEFTDWEYATQRINEVKYVERTNTIINTERLLYRDRPYYRNNPFPEHWNIPTSNNSAPERTHPINTDGFPVIPDNLLHNSSNRLSYLEDYHNAIPAFFITLSNLPVPAQNAIALAMGIGRGSWENQWNGTRGIGANRGARMRDAGRSWELFEGEINHAIHQWDNELGNTYDGDKKAKIVDIVLRHPFITYNERLAVGEAFGLDQTTIKDFHREAISVGHRNERTRDFNERELVWDNLDGEQQTALRYLMYRGTQQVFPSMEVSAEKWRQLDNNGRFDLIHEGIINIRLGIEGQDALLKLTNYSSIEIEAQKMFNRRMQESTNTQREDNDYINTQGAEVAESIKDGDYSTEEIMQLLSGQINTDGMPLNTTSLPPDFYERLYMEYDPLVPADVLEWKRANERVWRTPGEHTRTGRIPLGEPSQTHQTLDRMGRNILHINREQQEYNRLEGPPIDPSTLTTAATTKPTPAERARDRIGSKEKAQGDSNKAGRVRRVADSPLNPKNISRPNLSLRNVRNKIQKANEWVNSRAAAKLGISKEKPLRHDAQTLIGSMFSASGDPTARMLLKAWKRVDGSDEGKLWQASSSLSGDSYRAQLWLWNLKGLGTKADPNPKIDIEWHGWSSLNSSEFAKAAGIPTQVTVNNINDYIVKMNKKLPHGKRIPYAYENNNQVYVPQLTVKRTAVKDKETLRNIEWLEDLRKSGGRYDYKEGGAVIKRPLDFNDTMFIYQAGGTLTEEESKYLADFGVVDYPETGEVKEDVSITIDGEPIEIELAFKIYEAYIGGEYSNSAHQEKAEKIYDKMNRIFYSKAKEKGKSVGNYILSQKRQEGIYV